MGNIPGCGGMSSDRRVFVINLTKQRKVGLNVVLTMTIGTMKAQPALPNEIQDRILDFLHDSDPTIEACALVCRAWVPTSRYHLFSRIMLLERNADTFEELFKSPNCTIRSCTHLTAYSSRTTNIANVLRYLTPSSLHLVDYDLETLANMPPFPSIESLSVTSKYYRLDVMDLFVIFPNVHDLHMIGYSQKLPLSSHDRGDILICPPRLRSLTIRGSDINPCLRYFLERRIVPTHLFFIRSLSSGSISRCSEMCYKRYELGIGAMPTALMP